MGTHMWTNGASRRGRRMSLDLPPLPITPKDSEFLQRRPDLFYPYLPAPFLNGVQQKVSGCASWNVRAVSSINFIFISFVLFSRFTQSFCQKQSWGLIESKLIPRKIRVITHFRFYKFWDIEISIPRFRIQLCTFIYCIYSIIYIYIFVFINIIFSFQVNIVYDDLKYASFKVMSIYLLISDPIFKLI